MQIHYEGKWEGVGPSNKVGNFRQKNNSAEDGIDGTNYHFRRNSGCSAEQKPLRIPFQTLTRKRKQLGIPFRGTKIEEYSRIRFQTLPRKRKLLGIPFRESKIETNCRNSVPNHSAEVKQLGILFRIEQNATGYKKTGLSELE